jgi:hypothetical protein
MKVYMVVKSQLLLFLTSDLVASEYIGNMNTQNYPFWYTTFQLKLGKRKGGDSKKKEVARFS